MALSPGTRLGPYEVGGQIGAGGMGEVYRAVDTRLHRDVAIKVSADEFTKRFEGEALAVAALNHPNICQLYDVGPDYLVMEYVEGAPVAPGASIRKVLDVAVQIADGMAAAHAAGLVHRDLKPDNILVTVAGRVKILDFGLAKAAASPADAESTRTVGLTDVGTAVGTVAYMSPEQARGEPHLGPQSDQFSFGLVLYELVTGQRAFRRNSSAETMTAIIREDAEPLPAAMPVPFRWVIERLLAKDPADRYDSSRDLYRELRQIRDRLSDSTSATQSALEGPRRKRLGLWLLGSLAVSLVAGAAIAWVLIPRVSGPDLSAYRFTPLARDPVTEQLPAWSPDGKSIAYTAAIRGVMQVMTRTIGSSEAAQLTQGDRGAVAPFWSPEGSTVYYTLAGSSGLWAVGATGGTPELVLDGTVGSAAVDRAGKTFAFTRGGKLWVGGNGGSGGAAPREFGKPPFDPSGNMMIAGFAPDGSALALVKDGGDVWILAYPSGESRKVASGIATGSASWMPDSRRLVVSGVAGEEGNLSMVDTRSGARHALYVAPQPILSATVSPDGRRIAFAGGGVTWDLMELEVPSGRAQIIPSGGNVWWYPAWAPSGTHYAYAWSAPGKTAIKDVSDGERAGGFARVLVEMETGAAGQVRWAPDGSRLSFYWADTRLGKTMLMVSNASGGRALPVDQAADESSDGVWSPDGHWLAYVRRLRTDSQLVKTRPGSSMAPEVLRKWTSQDPPSRARRSMDWSPDGKWILTDAGLSGLFLVSADGATERQLSSRPFSRRVSRGFSRDGRQVLCLERSTATTGAEWQLLAIDAATGSERILAEVHLPPTVANIAGFSLHPDGTRLLTSVANMPYDIWMLEGFDRVQR